MTEQTSPPHILTALNLVMKQVTAVGKDSTNQQQGFKFRGIESVLNAVGPAFRDHGVVVSFELVSHERRTYETKKGTTMMETIVKVDYEFSDMVDGSKLVCRNVPGEASDAGATSMTKAMSLAYRTALVQALAIPTDEPDPDETSYERASVPAGPPQATKEEKDEMFARMQAIVDPAHRKMVKREFVANFGDLGTLPASHVDKAWSWIILHEEPPVDVPPAPTESEDPF